MRGAHAALSPNFGAPAMPAPWQATQAWLYTVSPGRSSAAATGSVEAGGASAELFLARDRDPADRARSAPALLLVDRIRRLVGPGGLAGDDPCEDDQADRDAEQDAQHEHECVEEGAVVRGAHEGSSVVRGD